jgi:sulfate permease
MEIAIFLMSCFFAVNMGASSFAASFATACGSGAISRRKAQFLYVFFIVMGAVLFGKEVSLTLGKGIVPSDLISHRAVLIILTAGTISLFTANLMHIPQSTSMSTIAAICGVGMFYQEVQMGKINYLAICWILSTLVSFIIIFAATRYVYPPRKRNFWVYEKIVQHKERLQIFVILTSCYNVFSQGTNNVPNVVGPLAGAGLVDIKTGLWVLGIVFGLGCFAFGGTMVTTSEKIVPLGILTATIVNFVSGTITLVASILGIPQPAVIIYTLAVFAIGLIKNGPELTLGNPVTSKTFFTWFINPVLTLMLSYLLSRIFLSTP